MEWLTSLLKGVIQKYIPYYSELEYTSPKEIPENYQFEHTASFCLIFPEMPSRFNI